MRQTTINFETGKAIEVAFATITKGKENQIFGEYFPKVGPIVQKYDGAPLGSIAIEGVHSNIGTPQMGALFQWKSPADFQNLNKDPEFLEVKPIRDNAMDFFTNGHFFKTETSQPVDFEEGQHYALIAEWTEGSWKPNGGQSALVSLTPISDDPDQEFAPSKLHICAWDDAFMPSSSNGNASGNGTPDVFKFKLNFPPQT